MEDKHKMDPPLLSDRDLVVAFQRGEGRAYDEIYRRHSPKIRVLCSRRLGDSHDAEEALQDTFLRAYQALSRFNGQYKLGPWLNRIAINVCIDQLRTRTRSGITQTIDENALEATRGPDEILASSRPEVIDALGELKPLHAQALKLQAVDGLSHEELAGRLEMTPAQVKSLLHRARVSFKRVLRGVSGWVVAPFAALRRNRGEQHALSVGGGAVQSMGFLAAVQVSLPTAERLATGAVLAVLALGSSSPAASIPENDTTQRQRTRAAHAGRQDQAASRVNQALSSARKATRTVDATAEQLSMSSEFPLHLSDVKATANDVVEQVKQELKEQETDGGNGSATPGTFDARDPQGAITHKAEETKELSAELADEVQATRNRG